jgi:hypothetical protein
MARKKRKALSNAAAAVSAWQDNRTARVEARQEGRTDRAEARSETRQTRIGEGGGLTGLLGDTVQALAVDGPGVFLEGGGLAGVMGSGAAVDVAEGLGGGGILGGGSIIDPSNGTAEVLPAQETQVATIWSNPITWAGIAGLLLLVFAAMRRKG